jgi:hypothetical protein
MKVRYCGRPGCRDPKVIEQERQQRDAEATEDVGQRQQREHGDDFGERTA